MGLKCRGSKPHLEVPLPNALRVLEARHVPADNVGNAALLEHSGNRVGLLLLALPEEPNLGGLGGTGLQSFDAGDDEGCRAEIRRDLPSRITLLVVLNLKVDAWCELCARGRWCD